MAFAIPEAIPLRSAGMAASHGRCGGPISGVFTGAARPMNSTSPSPPTVGAMRFQLFATQTLPDASICTAVRCSSPPLVNPRARGERTPPVRVPGGQRDRFAPHSSVRVWPMKLATQMLPLPSTAVLQGPIRLLALIGERGLIRPSGPIRVMLSLPRFATQRFPYRSTEMPWGELNPPPMIGPEARPLASILVTPPGRVLLIALSVTHLLPRASIAIANGFDSPPPVMTLAALGSPRGYSVTLFPTWFAIQTLRCWSTASP